MSRKKRAVQRVLSPDIKFGNVNLAKFINKIMIGGKKSLAEVIVYQSLDVLAEKVKEPASDAFEKALKNVVPFMEVRSRRVGGSTYQVPVEVKRERGISLAMRWIIQSSRTRSGKTMVEKLSSELVDAFNKVGTAIKKREDTHKMAEANKAFAHFRW